MKEYNTLNFNNLNINYFVYSDTHFGHKNILKYDNRPFLNIKIHDEKLISNWNKQVGEDDVIFFLGDFALSSKWYMYSIMERLNGIKYFIKGNHDKKDTIKMYKEYGKLLLPIQKIVIYKQVFILCHYPIESWEGRNAQRSIHIHGHCHTENTKKFENRYNVSANRVDYIPVNVNRFKQIKLKYEPNDTKRYFTKKVRLYSKKN